MRRLWLFAFSCNHQIKNLRANTMFLLFGLVISAAEILCELWNVMIWNKLECYWQTNNITETDLKITFWQWCTLYLHLLVWKNENWQNYMKFGLACLERLTWQVYMRQTWEINEGSSLLVCSSVVSPDSLTSSKILQRHK